MKILVIDDSLMDRKLIAGVIMKAGIKNEILQAENGEVALEGLGKNYREIGLILVDGQMPGSNGLEFMRGGVSVPATKSIPIIMVTASGAEEDKRQAYEVNPMLAGYVVKPYKSIDLVSCIKANLKGLVE
jgi:CheY-like chemotaxis protein